MLQHARVYLNLLAALLALTATTTPARAEGFPAVILPQADDIK